MTQGLNSLLSAISTKYFHFITMVIHKFQCETKVGMCISQQAAYNAYIFVKEENKSVNMFSIMEI